MTDQTTGGAPRIRFKGFDTAWEPKKLGQIYTERNERGNDSLPILSVSIHSGISNGELSTEALGKKVRRSEDKSLYKHVQSGDLVLNMMRAWQGALGVTNIEGMVSPAYITAIPDHSVHPIFMDCSLRRPKIVAKMNSLSYGVTDFRKRLYWDSFILVECHIPSVPEQKKVAEYFSQLERTIFLYQSKHDKLIALRQAMLQQLFPKPDATTPAVRFSGFFGDWEPKNVAEISGKTYGGGTPNTSQPKFWEGEVPWIQSSDVLDRQLFKVIARKRISSAALKQSPAKIVPKNSIAVVTRVGVGKLALLDFEYATSQDFLSLSELKLNPSFAAVAISLSLQNALPKAQGTAIKGINKDELLALPIMVPRSAVEQEKVGTYFRNLDALIAQHATKLQLLQEIKLACQDSVLL
jgi:type I restriction enzyme S subunit